MPEMDLTNVITFCPRCLGSENDSSWGESVDKNYCYNCGSPSTIDIPEWAVKSIREQASWVGKRYYPHEEDRFASKERKNLLKLVKEFHGRTAVWVEDMSTWEVEQKHPDGAGTSVLIDGVKTAAEALEKARNLLPYFPRESFPKKG